MLTRMARMLTDMLTRMTRLLAYYTHSTLRKRSVYNMRASESCEST